MHKETLSEHELVEVFNLLTSGYPPNILLSLQLLRPYYNDKQIRRMIVDIALFHEFEKNFSNYEKHIKANVTESMFEKSRLFHYQTIFSHFDFNTQQFVLQEDLLGQVRYITELLLCFSRLYTGVIYNSASEFAENFPALYAITMHWRKEVQDEQNK